MKCRENGRVERERKETNGTGENWEGNEEGCEGNERKQRRKKDTNEI